MKLGFFLQGDNKVYYDLASKMIASARKFMPDVPIFHFTDYRSNIADGVDMHVRIGGDLPMAMRRMEHHAGCYGDWLFVDPDVIFQKDVRDVFDEDFDVALTDRIGTYMENTEYAKQQPYNMGVTFSRNPLFWAEVKRRLGKYPEKYQQWEGDQIVVCEMAADQKTPFDIVIIPGKTYNFTPEKQDEDLSHAAIIHYKGARKAWIK